MKKINISDIAEFKIGNAKDDVGGTGCTVIVCEQGAIGGVDVRGSAPATKETDLLSCKATNESLHAVVLSGGSAFGLDATTGVMRYLEEINCGFEVGIGVVPIVAGASLFDLIVGDKKRRPDADMGYVATKNALENKEINTGNEGAGTGATVGKFLGLGHLMKSGLGAFAYQVGDVKCGAIVAVNALGDVYEDGRIIAGLLDDRGEAFLDTEKVMVESIAKPKDIFKGNTTIGLIITNAKLTKAQTNKVASLTHNAYARCISPVHTSADGDAAFAMASGSVEVNPDALGLLATKAMEKAIISAVKEAKPAYGLKCAADIR